MLVDASVSSFEPQVIAQLGHTHPVFTLRAYAHAMLRTVFEARSALAEYGDGREVACENIRRSISDGDGRALRARRVRAHLRSCNGCREFRSKLTVRRRDLALLAPGLSGGAAVALLQCVVGDGAAGTVAPSIAAGGVGLLGGSASTIMASTAAKGVIAIVAATAAGAGAINIDGVSRHRAPASSSGAEPAQAAAPARSSAPHATAAAAAAVVAPATHRSVASQTATGSIRSTVTTTGASTGTTVAKRPGGHHPRGNGNGPANPNGNGLDHPVRPAQRDGYGGAPAGRQHRQGDGTAMGSGPADNAAGYDDTAASGGPAPVADPVQDQGNRPGGGARRHDGVAPAVGDPAPVESDPNPNPTIGGGGPGPHPGPGPGPGPGQNGPLLGTG